MPRPARPGRGQAPEAAITGWPERL